MVNSQAIWGSDVITNNHQDIGTVQCSTHYAGRLLIPVSPEHQAAGKTSASVFDVDVDV